MKTILSLSALLITLTLTAQSNTATWYLNDTSGNGIQSQSSTASGSSSRALGTQTTASGNFSTALGNGAKAMADMATALGHNTTASGEYSTAMGLSTTASGRSSTAIGERSTAIGERSTAIGFDPKASGDYSTSMGLRTIASDYASTVIGQYNSSGSSATSADLFSASAPAFVIGNGTDGDNRSDALTVLFDGTTNVAGSVTATEFIGDGSQLTNLPSISPFSFNDESGGTGLETYTNTASGGKSSFAVGYHNVASGVSSTAMGADTTASGDYSTAMGYGATASGNSSFAAAGHSEASGYGSIAMGCCAIASGSDAIALGHEVSSSGMSSFAVGRGNYASGDTSIAIGAGTTASGDYSTAFGSDTYADGYNTTAIGSANTVDDSAIADQWNQNNRAFVIGNGFYDVDSVQLKRSDAFTVWFNGDATLAGNLNINSDARLKANIISLGSTLAKLLQIDGKTYTMKKDDNKKQKIGVLAQDIEKVFPELVSESNGVKSVNYQGLVPVLINALKEQDSKMNEQEARIERLEKLLLDS